MKQLSVRLVFFNAVRLMLVRSPRCHKYMEVSTWIFRRLQNRPIVWLYTENIHD
jgi:hypothetical protein